MKKTIILATAILSALCLNFETNAADSDARVMQHVEHYGKLGRENPRALVEERARVNQGLSAAQPGTPEWNQHIEKSAALELIGH